MTGFPIDPVLQNDCVVLGRFALSHLLLMNNSGLPWLILVPENTVGATELTDLSAADQAQLLNEINLVAELLKRRDDVEKLNIAALGNIVKQLHVHVVGRHQQDYCWPKLVWASDPQPGYSDAAVAEWRKQLQDVPGFVPA